MYDLPSRVPRCFHLTFAGGARSILEAGLRPPSWLVRRATNLTDEDKEHLLTAPRPETVTLELPSGAQVQLRDQRPLLRDSAGLAARLRSDTTMVGYLVSLNDRVFLFPSLADAERLASSYAGYPQDLLVLDTRIIVEDVGVFIELSRHNTGAMNFDPSQRYKSRADWRSLAVYGDGRPREITVRSPGLEPETVSRAIIELREGFVPSVPS